MIENFEQINMLLETHKTTDSQVTNDAQELIKSLITLANRRGLIIYSNANKVKIIFHVDSFCQQFFLQFYLRKRKIVMVMDEMGVNDVIDLCKTFFLNWENDLMTNNFNQSFTQQEIAKTLLDLLNNQSFFQKILDLRKLKWSSMYLEIQKESSTDNGDKFQTNFDLLVDQVDFDIEETKKTFTDMTEGGILCENSANFSEKNGIIKFSNNDNNWLQCKKIEKINHEKTMSLWVNRIKRTISELAYLDNLYHELFDVAEELNWFNNAYLLNEKIRTKIIKIIEQKYPEMPFEFVFATDKDTNFSSNEAKNFYGNGFLIDLKFQLFDKKFQKDTPFIFHRFVWGKNVITKHVLLLIEHKIAGEYALETLARYKLTKICKAYFYRKNNSKVIDLYSFLWKKMLKISQYLKISLDDKMSQSLGQSLSNTKCYFGVTYKNKPIFDLEFLDKKTTIFLRDRSKPHDIFKSVDIVHSEEPEQIYGEDTAWDIWEKISKILRKDFQNMWFKWDYLYSVTQTINHLIEINYGQDAADMIGVAINFEPTSVLGGFFKEEIVDGEKNEGLDFEIFFIAYNFKFKLNNYNERTFNIINSSLKLAVSFWKNISNIYLGQDTFLKTRRDLFSLAEKMIWKTCYFIVVFAEETVDLNLSFKDSKFSFGLWELSAEGENFEISLNWEKKTWEIKSYDGYNDSEEISR